MCAGKFLRGNPSFSKWHGEGQALALRFADVFRARSAGACPPQTLRCLNQDLQDSQDFQDDVPRGGEASFEKVLQT